MNLYGSVGQTGACTTFTSPVHLVYSGGAISFLESIDFTGSGSGTGVFAISRLHLTNCRLSGWDTAVLLERVGMDLPPWSFPAACSPETARTSTTAAARRWSWSRQSFNNSNTKGLRRECYA